MNRWRAAGKLQQDPVGCKVRQISMAADCATALVQQLLAFRSKPIVEPMALDVNQVVTGLERMPQRLIGENFEIQTRLDPLATQRAKIRRTSEGPNLSSYC